MTENKIKGLLFDMDGVLMDSELHYMNGLVDYMQSLGYQGTAKDLSVVVGTTMDTTYRMLSKMLDNKYSAKELEKINVDYFTANPLNHKEIMFDNIDVVLKQLKNEGYKMALCSSSPMKTIQKDLTEMGVIECFDIILSGEDFEKPKPDPDIYLHAMEALDLKPEECIIYEDSNVGIRAGIASKAITIARIDDRFNQDQSPADYKVADINEYYRMIKEI